MRHSAVNRLLWGIVPVGIGVVFLLNYLGFTNFDIGDLFKTFWPVILIVIGLQGLLLQPKGSLWWNPLVVLLGVFFLGRNLNLFEWELSDLIKLFGPIILILYGLSVIFRGGGRDRNRRRSRRDENRWNSIDPPPQAPPHPPYENMGPPPPPPPESYDGRPPFEPTAGPNPNPLGGGASYGPGAQTGYGGTNHTHADPKGSEHWRHQYWRDHHQPPWKGQWHQADGRENHSRFIGDISIGHDYFELKPINISHFIGDTTLDLTRAQIPAGETKIYISAFIGDTKVYVPNDFTVGVRVVSSCLIGDVKVMDQKRSGLFNQMNTETPGFSDSPKQVIIVVSSFIGDVRVTKVG
ncbi:cell wall-active antibiotics response protein LiaF [Cohnella zeiphila]|uniref:Cell wall-active antibiotics response protein n=1 Tax=Cohnella zeiphila TaxID=2761120 RepID=A0A7X0VWQ1_9BACL|nr:cell wall-active antibiotics response protein LiaF [Cohnella zeiphila]MBB6731153.1 cell wall-active antibiotics response protein [Cohnella zeiphila]